MRHRTLRSASFSCLFFLRYISASDKSPMYHFIFYLSGLYSFIKNLLFMYDDCIQLRNGMICSDRFDLFIGKDSKESDKHKRNE